ncbi:MAG: hypothetical protein KTR35_16510 [Gammaproteobacteria bacterium]|nr:hypothetical protein [Gammaproteobacteria bacterium]
MNISTYLAAAVVLMASTITFVSQAQTSDTENWQLLSSSDGSAPMARHESGLAHVNGQLYLMGGRGSRNVDRYDPDTRTWQSLDPMPLEMHHFQPVVIGTRIYIIGAFTCCYPDEDIISDIYVYNTVTDTWDIHGEMPEDRARGSAAAVLHKGKIYLLGGNTQGHNGGAVAWFDEYDPQTDQWTQLDDAPNARDHSMAAIAYGRLVASAGRQTSQPNPFANTVLATDVYDFSSNTWVTTTDIPSARAGALSVAHGAEVIVAGGEVYPNTDALATVEAFNVLSSQWRTLQDMNIGRHSGGGALMNEQMHVVAGSMQIGGAPETDTHEVLQLSASTSDVDDDGLDDIDETEVYLTDPLDGDTDDDGLLDGAEIILGSDPLLVDSDGDTLSDGDEVNLHGTDPQSQDTDGDDLNDANEIQDRLTDPLLSDTDEDGLADGAEIAAMTDPLDSDSDDDELSDGEEVNMHLSDPLVQDTDEDELPDGIEVQSYGTSPVSTDTDEDGLADNLELFEHGTDPVKADTDDDGLNDGDEIALGTDVFSVDTDLDGLLDGVDPEPLVPNASGNSGGAVSLSLLLMLIVGLASRSALRPRQLIAEVLQ